MGGNERAIVGIHRQRAAHDDLAGEVARLLQHVVQSRPVHGQEERIRILRGFGRRAGARVLAGRSREPLQLLLAPRVAENHFMPGAREQRAEFAAHQSRTQNADAHRYSVTANRSCASKPVFMQAHVLN
jgi:hypothetical protein